MIDGLSVKLESPNITIAWDKDKSELLSLSQDFKKLDENCYTLNTQLCEIPFVEQITLYFEKERLFKIVLFHKHENECEDILNNFLTNQKILEQSFGKGKRQHLFKVNKEDKIYKWKFKKMILTHKLWDRFGLEEILSLFIK